MDVFTVEILGLKVNLLAQFFGLLFLIFLVICYQKDKKGFLIYLSIAYVFCAVESALLYAYTNVACAVLCIIRNVAVLLYLRKGKELPKVLTAVFIIGILAIGVWAVFTGNWYDILPPALVMAHTLLTIQPKVFLLKTGSIFVEAGYLVFNLFIGSYIGVVRQIFAVSAAVIGVIKYKKTAKKAIAAAE